MIRKEGLVIGETYHIYSRSISDFKIFNCDLDYSRMKKLLCFYQVKGINSKFSDFVKSEKIKKLGFPQYFNQISHDYDKIVDVIGYCLMPTHLHIILKQVKVSGISTFVGNVLNSYSRFFNIKHKRKGPLWEGKFKNVLISSDEQLLHLTRYVHLNPVTAYLVDKPEEWDSSSYKEYIEDMDSKDRICTYKGVLQIDPVEYRQFVEKGIDYQREIAKIKDKFLE